MPKPKYEPKKRKGPPTPIYGALLNFKNLETFIESTQSQTTTIDITDALIYMSYTSNSLIIFNMDEIANHLLKYHLTTFSPSNLTILCGLNFKTFPSQLLNMQLDDDRVNELYIHLEYNDWKNLTTFHQWHLKVLKLCNALCTDYDNFIHILHTHYLQPTTKIIVYIIKCAMKNNTILSNILDKTPSHWCTDEVFNMIMRYVARIFPKNYGKLYGKFVYQDAHNRNCVIDEDSVDDPSDSVNDSDDDSIDDSTDESDDNSTNDSADDSTSTDDSVDDSTSTILSPENIECLMKLINKFHPNGVPIDTILKFISPYNANGLNRFERHQHCIALTLTQFKMNTHTLTDEQISRIIINCSQNFTGKNNGSIDKMLIQSIFRKCMITISQQQLENMCLKGIDSEMLMLLLEICGLQHNEIMFHNGVRSNNAFLTKYFLDQKYTFKEEYILDQNKILSATEMRYYYIGEIMHLLISYNVPISARLYTYVKVLRFDKDQLKIPNSVASSLDKFTRYGKPKKITTITDLRYMFGTYNLPHLKQNLEKNMIEPDITCFEAAMHNKDGDVVAYVLNTYSYIPQIFDVMRIEDFQMRFQVLNKFYPELARVASDPHYVAPIINKMRNVRNMSAMY